MLTREFEEAKSRCDGKPRGQKKKINETQYNSKRLWQQRKVGKSVGDTRILASAMSTSLTTISFHLRNQGDLSRNQLFAAGIV